MICFCFFQAEDGIRDLVRSRGLGDVYKRQLYKKLGKPDKILKEHMKWIIFKHDKTINKLEIDTCLLYTSDAADERSSVDLGGRRIIQKKKKLNSIDRWRIIHTQQ